MIIGAGYDEVELVNILCELGCYYDPLVDFDSVLLWLKDVNRRLGS